jgi:DNA polymerase III subunit delta'
MRIVGHQQIITDLRRLADSRQLAHGYVFFGPPRVGKRTIALALARYLEGGSFDDIQNTQPILNDADIILPGLEGSIGIDEAREARNFLVQFPNASPYRTVVIGDAERMTREAENAFLKIAEEPPAAGLLILVVQDPERLAPTLQSRFQKIYFSPMAQKDVAAWLMREHKCPKAKAETLAARSFGQPGLAWALFADERFREVYAAAEHFLGSEPSARAGFLKELVADDAFDCSAFLDAALMVLGGSLTRDRYDLWHRLLELRRSMEYFNLNPRLQLTALARLF